jgi:hypothetical protein
MNFIPDTKGLFYEKQRNKWAMIEALLGGEEAIKEAGKLYLPQLSGQTETQYKTYRDRGSFFNAFARTITGLTGAIIRKEPSIKTSPEIDKSLSSITLAGESIQEVIRMITQEVLSYGYYGILVDMPFVAEDKISPTNTNPYFALYPCASILNWETVQVGDESKLIMLTLAETVYKKDPENVLSLIAVDQVRLLNIDKQGVLVVSIFQKIEKPNKQGDAEWVQYGDDIYPKVRGKNMDHIPFVFFGAVSNNPIPTAPPLVDLANLNIKHWQVNVDYYHGLHFCAMPTPWASGFGKETDLYVGCEKAWVSDDPQAQCGFLEFTGTGLGAIEKALDKLECQMAIMGARMLEEQKKAAEAAETVVMRYSGDTATLSSIVTSVEQGVIKAIDLIGDWKGIEAKTEVRMNRDFVSIKLSAQDITALLQARQAGEISQGTFLYNLQVGEILPPDRTIEDEKALIENEYNAFSSKRMYDEDGNEIDENGNIITPAE